MSGKSSARWKRSAGRKQDVRRRSKRRAQHVRDFLITNGVAGSRLTAVGYGASRPAVPNDTEANRALNRRVQLEISPNEKARAENG